MKKDQEKNLWFEKLKKTNSKISKSGFFGKNEKILCPVCFETKFEHYHDICEICGWQHDWMQLANEKVANYGNKLSLITYKKWFKLKREQNKNYIWKNNAKEEGQPDLNEYNNLRKLLKGAKIIERKDANKNKKT